MVSIIAGVVLEMSILPSLTYSLNFLSSAFPHLDVVSFWRVGEFGC